MNIVESAAVLPPSSTVSVLTTLSLAVKPVISAVDTRQSPNPSGLNIGAIRPPIIASILFCEFVTGLILVSNDCRNHMIIAALKMIVNALVIKSFTLSHISIPTLLGLGIR